MTWSLTTSGDMPTAEDNTFVTDVLAVFKKYGADVHAFFFQHPNGTVSDLSSVEVPTSSAVSGTEQSGGTTAASAPTATAEHPSTGGRTVQAPASIAKESPAPTPPTIDLANVSTAVPVTDTGTPVADTSAQDAKIAALQGDVADIKSGLAAILAAMKGA